MRCRLEQTTLALACAAPTLPPADVVAGLLTEPQARDRRSPKSDEVEETSGETFGRALGRVRRPAPIGPGRATLRRSRRCGFRIPETVASGNGWLTSHRCPSGRFYPARAHWRL